MVTVSDIDYSTFRLLQQLLFALFFCDFRTFPLSFADVLQSIHQRRITLPRCVVDAWTRSSVLVAIGTSMDDDSVYSQFTAVASDAARTGPDFSPSSRFVVRHYALQLASASIHRRANGLSPGQVPTKHRCPVDKAFHLRYYAWTS